MPLCEDAGASLPTSLHDADLLTPYGVAPRQPAAGNGAAEAVAFAREAVAWRSAPRRGLTRLAPSR
jgi:hypothetical protein